MLYERTLGQWLEHWATTTPDKEYIVYSDRNLRFTWSQFNRRVDDMAKGLIAILLELVFVGKLAMKVAFRLVNPREASQTSIMLAISAASVWLMCPCMSFFATLLFKDSHNAQFFAIWVQTTVMNFPMALLWQFFAAGPLVRRIFGQIGRAHV